MKINKLDNTREKIWFLLLISFIEGGAVMAIELLGAQITAPFYGTSLYVWSAILAITLAGLTTGYFVGGLISEKMSRPVLYYILLIAAVFIAIMPITGKYIMENTLSYDFRFGAIVSVLAFVFPPLVLLGMVSPIIIRKLSTKVESVGRKAGTVYAISTIGGILATFIFGFYMIPKIGLRLSAFSTACIVFVFPAIYLIRRKILLTGMVSVFFLALGFYSIKQTLGFFISTSNNFRLIYNSEGILGHIAIIDDNIKNTRALLVNNMVQTIINKPTGRSVYSYIHRVATYCSVKPENSDVLIAGLGGGSMVKELSELGFKIDVCDIDSRTGDVSKKYFGMDANEKFFVDDARHFIRTRNKKYDIVILDMLLAENPPTNVYTIEGFNDIKKIMKDDAFLFVHYQNVTVGENSLAVKSVGKTLQTAGFQVKLLNTNSRNKGTSDNISGMFFATLVDTELSDYQYSRQSFLAKNVYKIPVRDSIYIGNYDFSDGLILVDDKPIIDHLNFNMVVGIRELHKKKVIKPFLEDGIKMFK
ncbi:MAG: fused MFS/spermidine synthase [Bacteroidia bacterium]|nr:fused MFS/spermidine synthase [Bacteroidia bacterium]